MKLDHRIRWLKIASAITIGFGLLIAAAALPALQGPVVLLLDLIYFPVDGAQTAQSAAARLLGAIAGGVMTGWGLMAWLVAKHVLPTDPALARRLILVSIGAWFVVDSTMSVAAGAPLNALFNVGFLLLFYAPVWSIGGHARLGLAGDRS